MNLINFKDIQDEDDLLVGGAGGDLHHVANPQVQMEVQEPAWPRSTIANHWPLSGWCILIGHLPCPYSSYWPSLGWFSSLLVTGQARLALIGHYQVGVFLLVTFQSMLPPIGHYQVGVFLLVTFQSMLPPIGHYQGGLLPIGHWSSHVASHWPSSGFFSLY
jgi:hypothetical protein